MKEKLTIALLKEAEDGSMVSNETHEMKCSEAIKKMAKALEEKSEQMARECLNSDPYNNPLGAEDLAEAALNALLEGHDDKR